MTIITTTITISITITITTTITFTSCLFVCLSWANREQGRRGGAHAEACVDELRCAQNVFRNKLYLCLMVIITIILITILLTDEGHALFG